MNAPTEHNLPLVTCEVETETEEETIIRLAGLSHMRYGQVRREEAKRLNVQVKILDDMVKDARIGGQPASTLPFIEHLPHDKPVVLAELLQEITAVIKCYIVLDHEQADAAALWVAHTHLTGVADVSPIAIINAPERACAKTLFQTVLGRLVYRPLFASNASLSALFRSIDRWKPTILIDEADTFFRDNAELQGMINAGYKQGGSLLRSESNGDNFEPKVFPVYCAKSIAGIALEKHLPDTTMSRGIVFNMRRKLAHETVQRFRYADDALFAKLASQLVRFADDYSRQVRLARPRLPDELSDRAQDNWEPLLAIAMCAGEEWVQRATSAALKMSLACDEQASTGNNLLADIKDVLSKWSNATIRTVDLIDKLIEDEDMGWSTYNRGKALTPRQLAKLLATYSIKPKTVRQKDGSTPKGYDVNDFKDAFTRYLKPAAPEEAGAVAAPATCALEAAATAQHPQHNCNPCPDLIEPAGERCGVAATTGQQRDPNEFAF